MVYLKDLKTQWPWNPNAEENLSDKEIYTHRISVEDASDTWRVPILPPMNGFAFIAMTMTVYGKEQPYTQEATLVLGETVKPMFGLSWDTTSVSHKMWSPLGFPLTHKMIAITEDGLDSIIKHKEACWGKVEFLAQRFDDLLEDESNLSYIFLNERTDKVEWILNEKNLMFKPQPIDGPLYKRRSKIVPSILRLLEDKRNTWEDTESFWNQVSIPMPLYI